ncbi:hypothetical protein GF386_03720 [Candidatus Pacearchaeota archaeon]|nr:hypothetical protein [Candidatus Pacearchaeota archaeon]MBD3283260.1 hypothetical protein [Candidatus Pacearchaeota archaeon]
MNIEEIGKTLPELKEVWRFTYSSYLKKGLCHPNPYRMLRHFPGFDESEHTHIYVARNGTAGNGKAGIIGTLSLTTDSEKGLPIPEEFSGDLTRIKQEYPDSRLGVAWRAIHDGTNSGIRKPDIFYRLIDCAVETGVEKGLDVLLFDYHPNHHSFYNKVLGLERVSETVQIGSLNEAKAILAQGPREVIVNYWGSFCRTQGIYSNVPETYHLRPDIEPKRTSPRGAFDNLNIACAPDND